MNYRETNLKVRQPLPETAALIDDKDKLSAFNGIINVYFVCIMPGNPAIITELKSFQLLGKNR